MPLRVAGDNVHTACSGDRGRLGRVGLQHEAGARAQRPPRIVGAEPHLALVFQGGNSPVISGAAPGLRISGRRQVGMKGGYVGAAHEPTGPQTVQECGGAADHIGLEIVEHVAEPVPVCRSGHSGRRL